MTKHKKTQHMRDPRGQVITSLNCKTKTPTREKPPWIGQQAKIRARKLYTSARIYEWKFGKGEWKLPFASLTGRVDFFGFVIIFEEKNELTSMFYSLQKQRKHSEERSFGRFKMSLKCDWMFTLVSSKCNPVKSGLSLN